MKYLLTITILIQLTSISLIGQVPYPLQFEAAPLYLNPALTGDFSERYRLLATHRNDLENDENDVYFGSFFSYDKKLEINNKRSFAYGVSMFYNSLDEGFSRTQFKDFAESNGLRIATSFIQIFGDLERNHLTLAIGGGLEHYQFRNSTSNYRLYPGEVQDGNIESKGNSFRYSNGVTVTYVSKRGHTCQVGLAIDRLNQSRINRQYNFHGNLDLRIMKRFSIKPMFLRKTGNWNRRIAYGIEAKYYYKKNELSMSLSFGFIRETKFESRSGNIDDRFVWFSNLVYNAFIVGLSIGIEKFNSCEVSVGYFFD